ncbi:class A beta-lactamase-related serine hydrolase [Saccharothrix sp. S26]|uniref:serine hydrolase n=1 Tax=Saccharothrix sp. S26 TaxID=2907215 RepID=UPI001F287444|nr:serine hydrolase [Saccharothrix sp. S26]MCE6999805.1 class A beta-lactamase-related serine hydrolase [Saccharothrix sp. S26]
MTAARVRAAFADAGVTGTLHAVDLDHPDRELSVGADDPVVLASVFKIPLLVALHHSDHDLTRRTTLDLDRSTGPTGIGGMLDPVTISLRDLAYLAVTVSDNAAADALVDLIGLDAVNDTLDRLRLERTRIVHRARDFMRTMAEDAAPDAPPSALTDPVVLSRLRALDPDQTNRGTARDLTTLLRHVWQHDDCAPIRRAMALQVWPHRLASGFPFDDVRVAGKTGTLPTVRNEIGVVEYPDGGRYAVAVFTRSASTAFTVPRADAVVGTAARLAVEHLRLSGRPPRTR